MSVTDEERNLGDGLRCDCQPQETVEERAAVNACHSKHDRNRAMHMLKTIGAKSPYIERFEFVTYITALVTASHA